MSSKTERSEKQISGHNIPGMDVDKKKVLAKQLFLVVALVVSAALLVSGNLVP